MRPICLILLLIGFSHSLLSQQKEIDSIKQALPNQESLDKVRSLNELAWYYKNSDIDSSIYFANQALTIGQSIQSEKAISSAYNSLANAFSAMGSFDSALHYHKRAFLIQEKLKDSLGMANSLNNQGIAYDELGNHDQSLTAYFSSLRLYEQASDDPFDVAKVLGNIGIVYKKQKEYEKVLEYYLQALEIYDEVNSEFGITVTKGNIGSVFLAQGDYENAIKYCEDAMEGYEQAGYTRYIPYMLCNIGLANDSLGNLQKARSLYLDAIEMHEEHDNKYELSYTLNVLATNYRKSKEYEKSLEASLKALNLAEEINTLEWRVKGHLEIARIYAAAGNAKEAYKHLMKHTALNDSLFEERKTKQIFELQTQYETEKKEQQIALQESEIAEQTAELSRRQTLLIASLAIIVLIILLALLQRSRLKKKQQLKLQQAQLDAHEAEINATIKSQEKERARYARDLHDGFGQMISILNMNLGNLKDNAKPDERQKVFNESEKLINEMYGELKSICFDLMPQTLINNGLQSGLEEFAQRINSADKVFIETNFFGLDKRLTELQEISFYRISQEWINNILKYSDADKVTLQITKDQDEITLLIEDNGSGFDRTLLTNSEGNGWKNLHARSKLILGELELETSVGQKGNVLIVNAPAEVKQQKDVIGVENTLETV